MRQFLIGLSPLENYSSLDDFEKLCRNNSNLIRTWYTTAPYWFPMINKEKGAYIHENEEIHNSFQAELEIIKKYHQKIQLTINSKNPLYRLLAVPTTKRFIKEYSNIDSIVALDEFIPSLKKHFPEIPLTYSVQNNIPVTKLRNLDKCDTIVLGMQHIRSVGFMERLKRDYGVKIELLLNNGGHILCDKDCSKKKGHCDMLQQKLVDRYGLDWCIAQQTLIPSELDLFPRGLVDYYKINSRPSTLDYIQFQLDFYSKKLPLYRYPYDFTKGETWETFCGNHPMEKRLKGHIVDVDYVLDVKSKIWSNILGRKVVVY